MKPIEKLFAKNLAVELLLVLCSIAIYFAYYSNVLLQPNSILSGITGDALKNYYTYAFHIKNDVSPFQFTGMNFPYGEHVVYTDGQPLLTLILGLFPFSHPYLIGILHMLLFGSFMILPLVIFKILMRLNIDHFSAFLISIGIALLSPQFGKIFGGHHALAYGCLIPLAILFLIEFIQKKQNSSLLKLSLFNLALFFIHPYMGFSLSLLSLISLVFFQLLDFRKDKILKGIMGIISSGIFPPVLFKTFMYFTDTHADRTKEPQGLNVLVENSDSLLAPDFGPFQRYLEALFTDKIQHLEGHSYLGLFTIIASSFFLVVLPFRFRKFFFRKELLSVLFASIVLLLISFGWHYKLLEFFGVSSSSLNQFRAVCRFAWVFYFVLPIFIFSVVYHSIEPYFERKGFKTTYRLLAILFFLLNFLEANSYFKKDQDNFWKFRNVLSERYLNSEEKEILKQIKNKNPQAILALPFFHVGSETYGRWGGDNSMVPSMIYSYHSGVPIFGVAMSRTSITETENEINLLNSYKEKRKALNNLTSQPIFIIKTLDPLLPDEERLLRRFKGSQHNDSLEFGFMGSEDFLAKKIANPVLINSNIETEFPDSNNVVYLNAKNKKPFLPALMKDYETIFVLDSNTIHSGNYVVCFHCHYSSHVDFPAFILAKTKGKEVVWDYYQSTRLLSGFYNGFSVFEYNIILESKNKYEFILKGESEQAYTISNFLLRPFQTDVFYLNKGDTIYNNFPN